MVWRFLSCFFWFSLSLILFVNLFQYSGATLPFGNELGFEGNYENTVFGFSSIFTFVETIGSDKNIDNALTIFKTAVGIVQKFSIDEIVLKLEELQNVGHDFGKTIVAMITFIFTLFIDILVLPFVVVISLVLIIISIIMFAFNLLEILAKFLLGGYNLPINTSGLLNNVIWILPLR